MKCINVKICFDEEHTVMWTYNLVGCLESIKMDESVVLCITIVQTLLNAAELKKKWSHQIPVLVYIYW